MTTARKNFKQADKMGTYYITVRCVRRAFLQGIDDYSGKDSHYQQSWKLDKSWSIQGFGRF